MTGPGNSLTRKLLRLFTACRQKIGQELHEQSLVKKEDELEVRRMVEMVLSRSSKPSSAKSRSQRSDRGQKSES